MDITNVYRNGLPAVYTSIACSICTTIISQFVLHTSRVDLSVATQTFYSVSIFVVAYWAVYFGLRDRLSRLLIGTPLLPVLYGSIGRDVVLSKRAHLMGKILFVVASEIFWIITLALANYILLSIGCAVSLAAFIAQWGINLLIWLPLLPLWEHVATYKLPLLLMSKR